jgi:hypothetical protein
MSESERQYRTTNFRPETLRKIEQAQTILAEYDQKLTVRQLYYQFVSRDLIANTPREYQNLTSLVTDARYAGLIGWDLIEDRGREPAQSPEWDSIDDLVDAAMRQFRLPRWANQKYHVELWVEKQALAGVLAPIARRNHITLMVNKGYSSASAMYESAQRMIEACKVEVTFCCAHCTCLDKDYDNEKDREICAECQKPWKPQAYGDGGERIPVVLYLGDHDPSGEDMVRDIEDRIKEFGVYNFVIEKIALTMPQIKRWKPPPNPAKLTDSRAQAYIAKYGDKSWELDALPPRELNRLVEASIKALTEQDKIDVVIAEEDAQRARLKQALQSLKGES